MSVIFILILMGSMSHVNFKKWLNGLCMLKVLRLLLSWLHY